MDLLSIIQSQVSLLTTYSKRLGTRKRGETEDEDLALERELLGDEKVLLEPIYLI